MRLQLSQTPTVTVILLTLTFLISAGDLRAQSAASVSQSGVAVLGNGQTMAGEISRKDGKVIVGLESGSRIYLAENRVLFTAATLSEAYWELAARTGPTDLKGQVSVFQWCLRNELFDEAANHLLVLQESQIPARRLSALDLDLQAKKKRADFRHTQIVERARKKQQLAKQEMADEVRKERIETLIGDKTRVTIPDLHRVPRRPIRNPQQPPTDTLSDAIVASKPAAPVRLVALTKEIDQFGNPVSSEPASVDPVSETMVRQVSYEQPIFSSPAIAASKKGQATKDLKRALSQPITNAKPLTNSGSVRRIPKPAKQVLSIASGFSAKKTGGSDTSRELPEEAAEAMADPFDANYFNRRFATPAVDVK